MWASPLALQGVAKLINASVADAGSQFRLELCKDRVGARSRIDGTGTGEPESTPRAVVRSTTSPVPARWTAGRPLSHLYRFRDDYRLDLPRRPGSVPLGSAVSLRSVTRKQHHDLIDRFYNDMWNRFDKSVFAEILHPDIRFRGSLGQVKVGFEEFGEYVDFIQTFSPNFHNEVVMTITEGDKTFARLTYTGTHEGEVFDLQPTGQRFEYAGAAVFTIEEGRVLEVWVLGDIYGLIHQLGSVFDDARDQLSPEDDKKMASEFPTPDMALTHILVVADVSRSSAWYEKVLGAELYRKSGSSVVFKFNESWLLLVNGGEPTKDKPDVSFSPPEPTAVHHSFTIRVEHCQAAYETLRDRGAEFLTPPYDWGPEIRCFFPDPDGHLWEISQLT